MSDLAGDLKTNLTALGFTGLETNVYLSLLKEDVLKVSELNSLTKISRTQLYPLLKRMDGNGYIETIASKPVTFRAVVPLKLVKAFEEHKKKQFDLLPELKSQLDELKPVQTISAPSYEVNIIKGEKNILSKIIELTSAAKKEIIKTDVFERELVSRSRELTNLNKRKVREGIKIIVHCAIEPQNLNNLKKLKDRHNGAAHGSLVKREPYCTHIFDRDKVLLAFYNAQGEQYDTAIFVENQNLAESFASKNIAPIENNPLRGEVYLNVSENQRVFLLPENALKGLSKKQLFKLGHSIGYSSGTKDIKEKGNRKIGPAYVLTTLSIQLGLFGWAKLEVQNNSKKVRLAVENAVVRCSLIRGAVGGFFSAIGKYCVEETKCIERGDEFCEFEVGLNEKKVSGGHGYA